MGRRRRRVVKVVKKKLPTVFSCPSCGEEAVRVVINRNKSCATVQCAACGIKQEVEILRSDQMVDVYCKFTDRFYGAKEPSAPKQTQASAQAISEEQDQPENQEESLEATTEIGETPDEIPQQSEEQTTEAMAQKTEEITDEGFQVEE